MIRCVLVAVFLAGSAQAQNFTTQAEVQPILEMTHANWIGLGTATGNDLLYFSHVLSWRCGLSEIRYSVNGAELIPLQMEPCHRDTNSPNAIRELPYVSYPLERVQSVSVEIVYPDGQVDRQEYARAAIRID